MYSYAYAITSITSGTSHIFWLTLAFVVLIIGRVKCSSELLIRSLYAKILVYKFDQNELPENHINKLKKKRTWPLSFTDVWLWEIFGEIGFFPN